MGQLLARSHGTRPGLKIGQHAVASLATSLDEVVDIQGIYVVEEGAILQSRRQGSMACKVAVDSQGKGTEFSQIRGGQRGALDTV